MFQITSQPIESSSLQKSFQSAKAGALSTFEGLVRNHNDGRDVVSLEYEAAAVLCEKEAEKIVAEARVQFDIIDLKCYHRIGKLNVGDTAVWVGVTAAHRDHAFKACRYIIDQLKLRLPIWKKEYYLDGDSGWVHCEECSSDAPRHQTLVGKPSL